MKKRKIFDIEKVGFGDEQGALVTANRMPKPPKVVQEPAPRPVIKPIIKQQAPKKKTVAPTPPPLIKKTEKVEAIPRFQAVEFISPLAGAAGKNRASSIWPTASTPWTNKSLLGRRGLRI